MMEDRGYFKIIGHWETRLYDSLGNLKDVQSGPNLVTTVGKDALAKFLNSAAAGATTFTAKYIAIGTGTAAETAADTAMNTEVTRTTGTVSYITSQIYQVFASFAAGVGTGAITEYGILDSSTAGVLYAHYTKSVVNKGAGDTLQVTAQITLS